MVLVVVTKGQQEALIPLATVQKQCTGMKALKKCSADFSALGFLLVVIKGPLTSITSAYRCQVILASWRNAHLCIWSVMVKPVRLVILN